MFEAATGAAAALLINGAYLTELRTGAAGALAMDLPAPDQITGALTDRKPNRVLLFAATRGG